jgi:hypothetical protein
MTMALEGGEGSASRSGCSLPPGKTLYPLYRMLGGPQGRSGLVQKISPPPGFDLQTVQPVASLYRLCYPAHIASGDFRKSGYTVYTHTISLLLLGYKDMGQSGLSITAPYIGTRCCTMASQLHKPLQHIPAATWLYKGSSG